MVGTTTQPSVGDLQLHPKYLELVGANHPIISQPSCSDLESHPQSLEIARGNHAAISQPSPNHLPAISRRFRFTPVFLKDPKPTTQPSGSGFHLYGMCVVALMFLFVLRVLVPQVFSQPSPSHLQAISWRSTNTTEIVIRWCQPPSHLPAILQRYRITPPIFGNN